MSIADHSDAGLSGLHISDRVEVRRDGFPPYAGIVEDIAPQFQVVWIRDSTAGERQMLTPEECEIRRL